MALVVTKGTAFPEGKREEEAGEVVVAGQHINSHIIGLLTKKSKHGFDRSFLLLACQGAGDLHSPVTL